MYIGVTSNLVKRIYEHKNNLVDGFSKKYNLHNLVYYEQIEGIYEAIVREKRLKKWKRPWKIQLVSKFNPDWKNFPAKQRQLMRLIPCTKLKPGMPATGITTLPHRCLARTDRFSRLHPSVFTTAQKRSLFYR